MPLVYITPIFSVAPLPEQPLSTENFAFIIAIIIKLFPDTSILLKNTIPIVSMTNSVILQKEVTNIAKISAENFQVI